MDELDNDLRERMLSWRGIQPGDECQTCDGSGVRGYGSTTTWRGGVGGQMMTQGVCDQCWGSGDRHRPWPNLRLRINLPCPSCGSNVDVDCICKGQND